MGWVGLSGAGLSQTLSAPTALVASTLRVVAQLELVRSALVIAPEVGHSHTWGLAHAL